MRQGLYWVQSSLKAQCQQQFQALRVERDLSFNDLRAKAISFEREWLDPLGPMKLSVGDTKAVVKNVTALRKVVNSCAEKPRLSDRDLERVTVRLLNAIFNVVAACIKYGVKNPTPTRIRWSASEGVIYIGELPYMSFTHGQRTDSFEIEISPMASVE